MHLPYRLRLVFGFVPWIAQGTLAASLGGGRATAVALALALVPVLLDLPRHRVKLLEVVTAIWFSSQLVAGYLGLAPDFRTGTILAFTMMAAIAWGGLLLGRPFTQDYAREAWPEVLWRDPGFLAINRLITALWGGIFTLDLVLVLSFGPVPPVVAAMTALKVAGALASILLPRTLARRHVKARLAELDPQPWPVPDLSRPRPTGVPWDVVVIGAGVAGLSAAALLAKAGRKVLVCEAHDRPGGCCSQWRRTLPGIGTFQFDAGVHDVSGLHERGGLRALLHHLEVEDRLEWLPMAHEIITPEGVMRLEVGRASLTTALVARHPGSADGIAAFLAVMEDIFHDMYGEVEHCHGIPRMPRDPDRLVNWPRRHPTAFLWMRRPLAEMLDHYVADPDARRSLSFLTGYLTDQADALTVARMAPVFGMLFVGGHYPRGGSQSLPDLLAAVIRAHGGEVRLKTPVERILVENGAAAGVILAQGGEERSRAVVGTCDAGRLLRDMAGLSLPEGELPRPSCSAFMTTLAVDMVPEGAPLKSLRNGDGRGLGIMIPSLADPSLCPAGCAVITLTELVPQAAAAAWDRGDPGYAAAKRAHGDALIARAGFAIPGLSKHILYRQDATPRTFERYLRSRGGAIYGSDVAGPIAQRKLPLPGLFLAGHGTGLGAGVEAVAISGMLVAEDLGALGG